MVDVTQDCFCHKIDPTQGPCQVCARLATRPAPDGEPVSMNRIVLQMEAASERDMMWERRWQALRALNYHNTNFVDSNGRWTLADFISYAGEVCGYRTHPAEPVDDHQRATNPVDDRGSGNTSDKAVAPAVVEAVKELITMLSPDGPKEEGCTVFDHTPEEIGLHVIENHEAIRAALAAMGERS